MNAETAANLRSLQARRTLLISRIAYTPVPLRSGQVKELKAVTAKIKAIRDAS